MVLAKYDAAPAEQEEWLRPPHQITRDEVAAWLADSVVNTVTVHRTDERSARAILERGVEIALTSADAGWGQGFYSSTIPDTQYGDAQVLVAVRLIHPLVIQDSVRDAETLETLLQQADTDHFREAIQGAGYDGVVVHFGPGDLMVVAFRDDQVKVVVAGDERG
jgi:hypothetical protein